MSGSISPWVPGTSRVCLAAFVLLLNGCLYIPSPSRKTIDGREVSSEDLAFLKPHETSKDEVIKSLGQPTIFWRDENIFIYRWVMLRGTLFWAIAGGYSATGGAVDVSQEFAFLIKFDGADTLLSSETLERPPMKSYGEFLLEWRDAQRTNKSQSDDTKP